jgi:uncharacterized membrane protein YgcG
MSDDAGGGYTGNADGAGYTGYDPGPNQSSADTPAPTPEQHEIYDPPIEHDPIGQAIVGLPFAIVTGVGEVASEGASVLAGVGKEVVAWGAAELGIGAVEHATEGGSESGEGGGGGSSGEDSSGGYGGSDAGVPGGTEY